jgi:hypothetical protein
MWYFLLNLRGGARALCSPVAERCARAGSEAGAAGAVEILHAQCRSTLTAAAAEASLRLCARPRPRLAPARERSRGARCPCSGDNCTSPVPGSARVESLHCRRALRGLTLA